MSAIRDDVHQVQPHVLSLTNATESGLIYSADEVRALADLAHARGMGVHMDGARFANAVAASGATAAALTCDAGVDALSFGFVKNGGMNAEALVFFDPAHATEARRRRKRAGHLLSKGRYLAAQLLAMLEEDRWLHCARGANAAAAVLAAAAGDRLVRPVVINELFVRLSAAEAAGLRRRGFDFYDWGEGQARLVTSWDQTEAGCAPAGGRVGGVMSSSPSSAWGGGARRQASDGGVVVLRCPDSSHSDPSAPPPLHHPLCGRSPSPRRARGGTIHC